MIPDLTLRPAAYVAVALILAVVAFLALRALARTFRDAIRKGGAQTAVAVIGTVVASAGVGHAMYDALAPDSGGLHLFALAEALVAALFLDLVVASCAKRARSRAGDAQAARLDVTVVLMAAGLSGLISAIHAGWSTAGLFRAAVPTIAALVWLGDVVTVLRRQRETDHERALRGVLAAVARRTRAETARGKLRALLVRRADGTLNNAMSVYAAADGDDAELAERVNKMHHSTDLLRPLGPSPWRLSVPTTVGVWPLPRPLPAAWAPLALPAPDMSGTPDPDPLLPTVKSLLRAVPDMSRPRLIEALREQGHRVGTDRAQALLRAAKPAVPDSRVNGNGRHHQ